MSVRPTARAWDEQMSQSVGLKRREEAPWCGKGGRRGGSTPSPASLAFQGVAVHGQDAIKREQPCLFRSRVVDLVTREGCWQAVDTVLGAEQQRQ